jgi:hypothetical protein
MARRGPKARIPASIINAVRVEIARGASVSATARKYGISIAYAQDLKVFPTARLDAPGPLPPELAVLPEGPDKGRLVHLYLITAAGIAWYEDLAKAGTP